MNIVADNVTCSFHFYVLQVAYGQSKTANIWMANKIDRRYASKNLHAYSLHPGGIWTGLQVHMDVAQYKGKPEVERMMKSPAQGAATTLVAAIEKDLRNKGGLYLNDCEIAEPAGESVYPGGPGYATWAYSPEDEARLWKESCKLLGIEDS